MPVKIKMASLAKKEPSYGSPEKTTKKVVRYPEVTITSEQMSGIEDLKIGKKARIVFECEVKGSNLPSNWDIESGRAKSDEITVTLCLLKGAIDKVEGDKA